MNCKSVEFKRAGPCKKFRPSKLSAVGPEVEGDQITIGESIKWIASSLRLIAWNRDWRAAWTSPPGEIVTCMPRILGKTDFGPILQNPALIPHRDERIGVI